MSTQKPPSDLLYGIHPILQAIKAKRRKIYGIYTARPTPKGWTQLETELASKNIPVSYLSRDQLTHRAGTSDHQGVIAAVAPFPFRQKLFDPERQKFLVMLDGIQDPRNLGAILRSAYCTGVQGVIITQKASAPLSAIAHKASAGLAEYLEIMLAPSAAAAALQLQKSGYHLYLAAFGGKSLPEITFQAPSCIVIGSEGSGISHAVLKTGTVISIPQKTKDISYNASVAAGIIFFEVGTQLQTI
jgi:23S rRNA (guanosine2251-2'-O)-methyltransferase